MKTIKLMIIAMVLLVGTTLTAANPFVASVIGDDAKQEITELLDNAYFEYEDGTTASVTFMINNDGELVILDVSSENNRVEDYVKSRLDHKKLENSLDQGKTYKLSVIFNSIN